MSWEKRRRKLKERLAERIFEEEEIGRLIELKKENERLKLAELVRIQLEEKRIEDEKNEKAAQPLHDLLSGKFPMVDELIEKFGNK